MFTKFSRGRSVRSVLLFTLISVSFSFTYLYPLDLTGNLRTSYYGLEGREPGGAKARNNLLYQSISLRATELGLQGLSLGANFRFRGDASDNLEGGGAARFYSLYLDIMDVLPAGLALRAGRQFLYNGVGTGHLDGLKSQIEPLPWLLLTGWVGTQARYGAEAKVASWNEAAMWGGRLLVKEKGGSRVGVSFGQRKRGGNLERKLLGFDVNSPRLRWADVYFKADIDLELDKLRNATLRVNPRIGGPLRLDIEYSRRSPTLSASSFFTIIEYEGYDEVRILPTYTMKNGLWMGGEYSYVRYRDDDTHRARGGVSWQGIGGGLLYRQGYAGGRFGGYASMRKDLPHEVEGLIQFDYVKFNLVEGGSLRAESLVAIFRLTKRMAGGSHFVIELQEGRNPAFESDFRVFARIDYRFNLRR